MKQTYLVTIDALRHERNKDGYMITTLYLKLPNETNTDYLDHAHRIATSKKAEIETVEFKLRVREPGGSVKTYLVESKDSKSKAYAVWAVVTLHFNRTYGFERCMDLIGDHGASVQLEVKIEKPKQDGLFGKSTPIDGDDDRDGQGVRA